ncbi:thiazole biosynthesis protein ThiF [Thermocladium modestius]|uniref:Thiazole biosynthesis protein ThiF n=1 Tax=Thermocladium modestius TaxID=62609 RepID=A0A830GYY7_9CREN|nr:HesA/MoeB/ThiF family protein [Thermocladium modestius]GGP21237.1 thiazole biosynthesis protein ThiF [Thermocladium modestius]
MERYARQVPLLGLDGQARLGRSSIAVIGLGGLGSIASMYLAGAGVGRLVLVDFDSVSVSDLHRQLLYTSSDLGKPKADAAAKRLREINPEIKIEAVNRAIMDQDDAEEVVREADILVLAVDNWRTRQLINASAVHHGKPISHGAINGWVGMATTVIPGITPCIRELSGLGVSDEGIACLTGDCSSVIGPVAGVVASIQSSEAIRIAAGLRPALLNKLLVVDLNNGIVDYVELQRDPKCPVCGVERA